MRKQNTQLAYIFNALPTTDSTDCVDTSTTKCFFIHEFIGDSDSPAINPTGGINLTSDYESFTSFHFSSCLWRACKANYGGGIYLSSGSSVSLSIAKGEFYSCTVNSG